MAGTVPIPVRLGQQFIDRLDAVAERIGSNRAAIIRICVQTFVEHVEQKGVASLPPNWDDLLSGMDNRTKLSKNPAVHPKVLNLMPDSTLDPKVKKIADDIEALEIQKLIVPARKKRKKT